MLGIEPGGINRFAPTRARGLTGNAGGLATGASSFGKLTSFPHLGHLARLPAILSGALILESQLEQMARIGMQGSLGWLDSRGAAGRSQSCPPVHCGKPHRRDLFPARPVVD
jgi:hypothetical protein